MNRNETTPYSYLSALLTVSLLGSLLSASKLLEGSCLAFAALAIAGALMLLLAPLFLRLLSLLCLEKGRFPLSLMWFLTGLSLLHGAVISYFTILNLHTTFLPHTPILALSALLLAAPLVSLRHSDATLFRLSHLLLPSITLLLLVTLYCQTQWRQILGILRSLPWQEARDLPKQSLLMLALVFLNPAVSTSMLFPDLDPDIFLKIQRKGVFAATLALSVMLLMPVTTLGVPLFQSVRDPLYWAADVVIHGTPLVRVDALLNTVIFFTTLTDLSLCLQTLRVTLREWRRRKQAP
ncbi:MAG: hypothetical protein IJL15_01810 [Clostridia bacterium]|nr:hypothetical protein [Clostridia bacterium]